MWNTNFGSNETSRHMQAEEARRQAEVRRLQLETGDVHLGRLFEKIRWGLGHLGRLMVSLGQRLEQASQSQTRSVQDSARERAHTTG
jgi:hypothetical protein